MPITVTDPDGQQHTFADGTPTATIQTEMQRRLAARINPQPQPTPLTTPGQMPPGVNPGSFSAKPGSDLEADMVPLSAEAQRGLRMIAGGGATNNRNLEMAGRMLLEKDPTYQARKKQADAMGEAAGQRQTARGVGENVLSSFAKLLHSVNETPDEVLTQAIGPRNTAELQENSPTFFPWTTIPIPGFSGPTTVDPATKAPIAGQITPVRRAAILNPQDEAAAAAWNTQNLYGHDVHGITNALAAGAAKGMKMTDERQKMFDSTMRDFMQATNRTEANRILNHAKSIIQNDFNLTPKEADNIVNREMQRHAYEQRQKILERSAEVPRQAVIDLMSNPTPKAIRSFNKHLNGGESGLAEYLLRSSAASPEVGTP